MGCIGFRDFGGGSNEKTEEGFEVGIESIGSSSSSPRFWDFGIRVCFGLGRDWKKEGFWGLDLDLGREEKREEVEES